MDRFYIVTRVILKAGSWSNSVQRFDDERQATQRYYNIIAADLADTAVTYQFVSIYDCWGNHVGGLMPVVYDRRDEPEPEPENESEE